MITRRLQYNNISYNAASDLDDIVEVNQETYKRLNSFTSHSTSDSPILTNNNYIESNCMPDKKCLSTYNLEF